jgi:hypothetical protein
MSVNITRLGVEVLGRAPGNFRATRVAVEVLGHAPGNFRVTRLGTEVLGSPIKTGDALLQGEALLACAPAVTSANSSVVLAEALVTCDALSGILADAALQGEALVGVAPAVMVRAIGLSVQGEALVNCTATVAFKVTQSITGEALLTPGYSVQLANQASLQAEALVMVSGFRVGDQSGIRTFGITGNEDNGYWKTNSAHTLQTNTLQAGGSTVLGEYSRSDMYLRFQHIDIPRDVPVTYSSLSIRNSTGNSSLNTFTLRIKGVKQAYAWAPTVWEDVAYALRTTNYLDYSIGTVSAGTTLVITDLSQILSEIVGLSDWQSGNSIELLLEVTTNPGSITSFTTGSGSTGPKLYVEYGPSGYQLAALALRGEALTTVMAFEANLLLRGEAFLSSRPNVYSSSFQGTLLGEALVTCTLRRVITSGTILLRGEALVPPVLPNAKLGTLVLRGEALVTCSGISSPQITMIAEGNIDLFTEVLRSVINIYEPATPPTPPATDDDFTGSTGGGNPDAFPLFNDWTTFQQGARIDIRDPLQFNLSVNGTQLDFSSAPKWEPEEFMVSYDAGKELSFSEIGDPGYGDASVPLNADVTLTITGKTYFRGKVRRREHQGKINAERISYTAYGIQQLANEVTLINTDLTPNCRITNPTTITSTRQIITFTGSFNIPRVVKVPRTVKQGIQGLFTHMAPRLSAQGIPTAIDFGAAAADAVLPGDMFVSGGFTAALNEIASHDPGCKVYFDDVINKWRMVNLFETPTAVCNISSLGVQEHSLTIDLTDRWTAVQLVRRRQVAPNQDPTMDLEPIVSVDLYPLWDQGLEQSWSAQRAQRERDEEDTLNFYYAVYREWLIGSVAEPAKGAPIQIWHRVPPFGINDWAHVDGQIIFATDFPSAEELGRPKVFIDDFLPREGFGVLRAGTPIVLAGDPNVPGDAIGPRINQDIALVYYAEIPSDGQILEARLQNTRVRFPSSGFTGTAKDLYGVERTKVIFVEDQLKVTVKNAKNILRIYKDVIASGDIPIKGDPLPELLNLQRKIVLAGPLPTPLGAIQGLMTQYRYKWGNPGESTITLNNDVSGLVRITV